MTPPWSLPALLTLWTLVSGLPLVAGTAGAGEEWQASSFQVSGDRLRLAGVIETRGRTLLVNSRLTERTDCAVIQAQTLHPPSGQAVSPTEFEALGAVQTKGRSGEPSPGVSSRFELGAETSLEGWVLSTQVSDRCREETTDLDVISVGADFFQVPAPWWDCDEIRRRLNEAKEQRLETDCSEFSTDVEDMARALKRADEDLERAKIDAAPVASAHDSAGDEVDRAERDLDAARREFESRFRGCVENEDGISLDPPPDADADRWGRRKFAGGITIHYRKGDGGGRRRRAVDECLDALDDLAPRLHDLQKDLESAERALAKQEKRHHKVERSIGQERSARDAAERALQEGLDRLKVCEQIAAALDEQIVMLGVAVEICDLHRDKSIKIAREIDLTGERLARFEPADLARRIEDAARSVSGVADVAECSRATARLAQARDLRSKAFRVRDEAARLLAQAQEAAYRADLDTARRLLRQTKARVDEATRLVAAARVALAEAERLASGCRR